MFGFKKKENKEKESKREELLSVVDGTLIPIEEVKDPVFSQKMMGDGFTCMCEQGKTVKKGEALLKMDREYLLSKGYDLTVIVIFTNAESYKEFRKVDNVDMKGGESIAVTYTV